MLPKQKKTLTLSMLAICVGALVLPMGCKSPQETPQATGAQPPSATAQPFNPFMPSIERALPYYAEGYNKLTSVLKKILGQYERAVKDSDGVPKKKPIMMNVFTMDEKSVEDAAALFVEGKKAAPVNDTRLSTPADNAVIAARAVIKDYKDAYAYYSAEKYKDDQGAGGREIHTRMTASSQNYQLYISSLDQQLTVIEQQQMVMDLKLHGDATTYGHQFRAFNMVASSFMKAEENIAALDNAYADLDAAYKKVKTFATGLGPNLHQTFNGYMLQVDNLYAQATVVQRNLHDKVDPNKITTDFDLLVSRYNALIQLSNSLYQLESQGLIK